MKKLYARMEYPNNGYAIDKKHASLVDSTEFYEIEFINIYSSSSEIGFKQFTHVFNSVNFKVYEYVEDESKIFGYDFISYDIFSDPEINTFLKK